MGKIIAVANQKGGVGKTTTAVNLACGVASRGNRVLLCDFDPQGNATTGVGLDPHASGMTVYDALVRDVGAKKVVKRTPWCDVIPANIDLAGAEIELVDFQARESRLKKVLGALREDYNYVFIDCPPSLGLLTLNALTASDTVLVPIQCEYYALEGLSQLMNTVRAVKSRLNPDIDIEGIVMTMYDSRTNLTQQVAEEIKRFFGPKVYATVIPRNVRLSEAPSHGKPIMAYDKFSRGGEAYLDLTDEFIRRAKKQRG